MDAKQERVTLSPADAAAVDGVLNGESGGDPARRQRVQGWLKVLDASPMPEPAGDLAARTLARLQGERLKIGPAPVAVPLVRGTWRRRLAEYGAMAVAAILLLAVTLEGVSQAKRSSARQACAANLKQFTSAFNSYSNAAEGELPMLAMPSNKNWLRGNAEVGGMAAMNNAANLLPLITGSFLSSRSLYCAGAGIPEGPLTVGSNELPPIGYSYCNLYGTEKPSWDGTHATIVLADRNPVFAGDVPNTQLRSKNSANHDGKGNYLLCADGSVQWMTSPNAGPDHDNIWTIGGSAETVLVYTGREVPTGLKDAFLVP